IFSVTAYTPLKCYNCQGYDDTFRPDNNANNKYCSNKYWDASKAAKVSNNDIGAHFDNPFCVVLTYPSPTKGRTLQVRTMWGYTNYNGVKTLMSFNGTTAVPANLERSTESVDMNGNFCQKDLCNSAIGSLKGGSLLIAVCLTLLTKLF
ncbi:unnamed protein product, partial [Meganyctiphanes norvegica]